MTKLYFRTNIYDGKAPTYDLMLEGVKLCELSYVELMELVAQGAVVAASRERK